MKHREIPVVAVCLALLAAGQAAFWLSPRQSYAPIEKRALQAAPTLQAENLADGSFATDVEAYVSDHFPARTALVGINAYLHALSGRSEGNGIYHGKEGWLLNAPVERTATLQQNLRAISNFARRAGKPAALLVVPSTGYLLQDKLPAVHKAYQDGAILQQAKQAVTGVLDWVELETPFRRAQTAQLFYKTDHHWTSRGAYTAYKAFCALRGLDAQPEGSYQVQRVPGFYGTTYAKSGLWATAPDTIELWRDPTLRAHVRIEDDNRAAPIVQDSVFFEGQLAGSDQYTVFLDGNHSRVRITNPNAQKRKLLLIKDSFAHCLAPFLAQSYSQIDMIDLRYCRRMTASALLKAYGSDELLFVYGMDTLVNGAELRQLR